MARPLGIPVVVVCSDVGRFRELAEAGGHTAMVRLVDLGDPTAVDRFAPVVDAFRAAR